MYDALMQFLALSLMVRLTMAAASLLILLIPILIAWRRNHPNFWAIAALDLLLGWTFVGWAIAIVWSLTAFKAGLALVKDESAPVLGKLVQCFRPSIFELVIGYIFALPLYVPLAIGCVGMMFASTHSWWFDELPKAGVGEWGNPGAMIFANVFFGGLLVSLTKFAILPFLSHLRRSIRVFEYGVQLSGARRVTRMYSGICDVSLLFLDSKAVGLVLKDTDGPGERIELPRAVEAANLIEEYRRPKSDHSEYHAPFSDIKAPRKSIRQSFVEALVGIGCLAMFFGAVALLGDVGNCYKPGLGLNQVDLSEKMKDHGLVITLLIGGGGLAFALGLGLRAKKI